MRAFGKSDSQDLLPKDQSISLPTIEHCLMALSHRSVMAGIGEDNLRLQPLFDALVVMAVALTDEDAELHQTGKLEFGLPLTFSRAMCRACA